MIVALTREPARDMSACELTYLGRQPVDGAWAAEQHRGYRRALEDCGARVVTLPAIDELPDSVFVEDTAIVLDELAVLTSPGVESRRPELRANAPEIARLRPVAQIALPATIEGGDVLRIGRKIYVGLSPRTNLAGVAVLSALVAPHGYEVFTVALRDCLHLKSGCTAIGDGMILANPDWIEAGVFRNYEIVTVHAAEPWAANTLRVGTALCVGADFPRTAELLAKRGYDVRIVDVSEFAKAEGGLTCMSLLFQQP